MNLQLERAEVAHGETVALAEVDLQLPERSRLLVVGPAASGKTTLLKLLAGLQKPLRGLVRWDGREVGLLSPSARRAQQARLGMVFQTDALFDSMTVLENVRLPLVNREVAPKEATARARAVLERVGLADAESVLPESLSGGMKKRAGIARAVVARPEVLLVDEPLAGLDPRTGAKVIELLNEVSLDCSMLVCASEPPPTLAASRRALLTAGRLTEVPSAEGTR